MAAAAPFAGFSRAAVGFLADLAVNNERSWFQPRKAEYERLLKEPLEALCLALADRFEGQGLPLRSDPAKSPFRIYRDVRFSADKSPYKTHVSASFPWVGEGGGVGAYFHFQPGEMFAGGGMWHPEPVQLAAWRHAVESDLESVQAVLENA
ncbi:MAG: TIGR02453 family protein, partial [Candidatus Limnocylindrales bacterium]